MAAKLEIVWTEIVDAANSSDNLRQFLIYDLNQDGLEDILSFGVVFPPEPIGTAPLRVYQQNANGTFTAVNPMADGSDLLMTNPRDFVVADFNGDGIKDIFVVAHGYDTNPFPGEQNRLLLGVGNGKLMDATNRLPALDDFSHGVAAADIDGDGDIDIYVANLYGQHALGPYLLINDGNGNFTRDTARLPVSVVDGIARNEKYMMAEFADLNNDGTPDLILGGDGISSRVYWGAPGGQYTDHNVTHLPFTTSAINTPHQFIIHDFDNDGRLDILNLGGVGLNAPGALQMLINDGGYGFIDKTAEFFPQGFGTQVPFYGARLIDINNDGWLDIVRTNDFILRAPPSETLFWLNDGTNRFNSVTMGQLGLTDNLMQTSYVGPDGDIRWLSQIRSAAEAQANLVYYKTTDAFETSFPSAPQAYLIGQHDGLVNVARFYNTQTGTHFYTGFAEERDGLRGGGKGFIFEGNAFDSNATAENGIAVFRFYSSDTGTHFYTANAQERDHVIATLPGMHYEGVAYHAYDEDGAGRQGLHRFYNTQTGTHFYTGSEAERDDVLATLPQFNYEGVAFYVDFA